MALTIEWRRRIDWWRGELRAHLYRPLVDLDLEGFVTTERLPFQKAQEGRFTPMPVGTAWGAKWEYAWVRGTAVTPKDGARKRIALNLEAGGEALVYVNGKAAGARDQQHEHITLARQGRSGERWAVLAEVYAGHGPMVVHAGPVPPGRQTVPEPGPTQRVVGRSTVGIWDEEVYQLQMDVQTLWLLRECLDQNSLRVSQIDDGLRDLTTIVDFEQPLEGMLATVERCRRRGWRRSLPAKTVPPRRPSGPSAMPTSTLPGCGPWPRRSARRHGPSPRSSRFSTEYPEFRFLQSTPQLYQMVKDLYPDLYPRVKAAVKEGRIIPEGGMWVESDTNVPAGESLIRQFLHGQRFFREEFGLENEMLWLPDVFGYSGALAPDPARLRHPLLLHGQDLLGLQRRRAVPVQHLPLGGHRRLHGPGALHQRLQLPYGPGVRHPDAGTSGSRRTGSPSASCPSDSATGAAAPTRDHLEYIRRLADLEGAPRVKPGHPVEFFHRAEKNGRDLPRYVGELYFQAHRGTYTSQARTKRANRKSEVALREAETWAASLTR